MAYDWSIRHDWSSHSHELHVWVRLCGPHVSVLHLCYLTWLLISNPAEEVEDAGRTLPASMMWSVYLNGLMGFIMAITICFCPGDFSGIVDTPTRYPFIQLFYNVTKSHAATNTMVTIMIITLTACGVSEVATASRQLWSFARDKGIPFSDWFAYVSLSLVDLKY